MTNAISMTGLTKRYRGVDALSDLTLDVPSGLVFGFLGPNGAGKSTAMKLLAGLAHASSGSATINGVPVSASGAHRAQIGYLAQDPRFYDWMTGRETLRYVARFRVDDRGRETRIADLLTRVGLADAADRRTSTYSGGMRQRLGIAQTLVGRPSVILLDEPVSALDPIGRKDVLELMQDLKGETTVFYSTHILDDVERVSDHVAILDHGRLVTTAATATLLGSFTRNTLRVVLGGADVATDAALLALDGVVAVAMAARDADVWTYDVTTAEGATGDVQRAVTTFAVTAGLTLITNSVETLDLESVFLRLIDSEGGGRMTPTTAIAGPSHDHAARGAGSFLGFTQHLPQGGPGVGPWSTWPRRRPGRPGHRALHRPDPVRRQGHRPAWARRRTSAWIRPPTSSWAGRPAPSPSTRSSSSSPRSG